MRLVAWNANYNSKRRSLEQDVALLDRLNADILVLSETAQPNPKNPLRALTFGETSPCLAVVARHGFDLTAHPANAGAPAMTAGFEVSGNVRFNLVAAWPVKSTETESYHHILMATLERYADILGRAPAILAGDLNSSARVLSQRRSHGVFVEHAQSLGLVSAYHFQTGETHGAETVATYIHGSGETREFHLDYCFVSSSFADLATFSVIRNDEWSLWSDHYPVVVDVPSMPEHKNIHI